MSRRSRDSTKFAFYEADKLEFKELNYNRYEEPIEQLSEALIRKYIEEEAKAVQAERENDVSDKQWFVAQTPQSHFCLGWLSTYSLSYLEDL